MEAWRAEEGALRYSTASRHVIGGERLIIADWYCATAPPRLLDYYNPPPPHSLAFRSSTNHPSLALRPNLSDWKVGSCLVVCATSACICLPYRIQLLSCAAARGPTVHQLVVNESSTVPCICWCGWRPEEAIASEIAFWFRNRNEDTKQDLEGR